MVEMALLTGVFAYSIFALGLLGCLERIFLVPLSALFVSSLVVLAIKKQPLLGLRSLKRLMQKDKVFLACFTLLFLQALVNLIGALGPELGFDALWYHLTIPKIYLQHSRIFFIPGGLFYYSAMPRLGEMLYLVSLVFSPLGIGAKLIHFSFGLLSTAAIYQLACRYLKSRWAILTALIFYTTLIVGWQSITAYVDLTRTFFEVLALKLFLKWGEETNWGEGGKREPLFESALVLGLAASTKLLALATLPIFLLLALIKTKNFKITLSYLLSSLGILLPWFVFALVHTGNPVYPLFSGVLDQSHQLNLSLSSFVQDLWQLLYRPNDPISPLYLIFLPLIAFLFFKKRKSKLNGSKLLGVYAILTLIFWGLTPNTGGSRFILPYLPVWSFLLVFLVSTWSEKFYQRLFIVLSLFVALINIGYRALANHKFIPLMTARQIKDEFMVKHLRSSEGSFYDYGGEIKKRVDGPVLFLGGHNLFYADFPFVHHSYAQPQMAFKYLLSFGQALPPEYQKTKLVYHDQRSGARLYLYGGP